MMASKPTERTAALAALAAEAEAEAAEAEAQAARARARAAALRAEPEALPENEPEPEAEPEPEVAAEVEPEQPPTVGRGPIPRWFIAAGSAALVLICGFLAASGYLLWQHHQATKQVSADAAFAAAARQGVVNLMSLDFNRGDADIQRLIDSTTGQFRADFEKSKNDFLTVMKDSKVVTEAEVKATAVESMSQDSAVVLVAATSQVSNSAGAKQNSRAWRFSVTVERDNGQLKLAKVEFVP